MREILFRGQTRKYGEKVRICDGQKLPGRWVYGGVLQGAGSNSIIYGAENINDPSKSIEKWCVHTDTLGQYTGIKDKHGKRIFEGDILTLRTGIPYVVMFEDGGFVLTGTAIPIHHADKFEVIGNVHDNPELLEK